MIRNAEGMPVYAQPDHSWRWADAAEGQYSVVTPCTADQGGPNPQPLPAHLCFCGRAFLATHARQLHQRGAIILQPCFSASPAAAGDVPRASPGAETYWNNTAFNYPKLSGSLQCVDDGNSSTQTWPKYAYPGCIANQAERDYAIRGLFRYRAAMHLQWPAGPAPHRA